MSFKGYRLPYIKPQLVSLSNQKRAEILKHQEQDKEDNMVAKASDPSSPQKENNRCESGSSASGSSSKLQSNKSQKLSMQVHQNNEEKKKDHPENSPYHNEVANGGAGLGSADQN